MFKRFACAVARLNYLGAGYLGAGYLGAGYLGAGYLGAGYLGAGLTWHVTRQIAYFSSAC